MRLIYIGIVFFIFSCGNSPDITQIDDSKNVCKYSKWLRISETKETIFIEIINPDNPAEIYRLKLPNFKSKGSSKDNYDIEKPVERMAVLSSTHIGMLAELNMIERIVAVSDLKYVFNAQLKSQHPVQLGEEQTTSSEKIIKSKAELVVYNGFSNKFPKQELLNKLSIKTLPNYDWRETHPLGRAEWILLFGYLTGHQDEAKRKFEEICANYERIKSQIDTMTNVKILSGNMTGDYWYAPAGQSYHARLFNDAGLSYLFSNQTGTGSIALSFEKVLGLSSDVDLWLNPGFDSKRKILNTHPKSKLLPPLNQSSVFCYSHDLNKYWELSACRPDLILADFAELKKMDQMNLSKLVFYKMVK